MGKNKPQKGQGNQNREPEEEVGNKKHDRQLKKEFKKQRERFKYGDDTWKSDWRKFEQQLAIYNLIIKDVTGDGNCLFRALSDQLEGTPDKHMKIRTEICDFLEKNRESFAPFIDDTMTFEYYLSTMKKNATWGGHIEIQIASLLYRINIIIHQLEMPRWEVINHPLTARTIHLSYHNQDHYASVRPSGHLTGIPPPIEIKSNLSPIAKPTNPQKKDDILLSADEKLIVNSTGCDFEIARNTLKDFSGDIDATIEYLIALKNIPNEEEFQQEINQQFFPPSIEIPVSAPTFSTPIPSQVSSTTQSHKTQLDPPIASNISDLENTIQYFKEQIRALKEQKDIILSVISFDQSLSKTLEQVNTDMEYYSKNIEEIEKQISLEKDQLFSYQIMLDEQERTNSKSSDNNNNNKHSTVNSTSSKNLKESKKDVETENEKTEDESKNYQKHKNKQKEENSEEEGGEEDEEESISKNKKNVKKHISNRERKRMNKEKKKKREQEKIERKPRQVELIHSIEGVVDLGALTI